MATTNIDDNEPGSATAVNLPVLLKLLDRLIQMADNHSLPMASDERQLLNTLRNGTTTGSGTVSGIVVTYT